MPSFVLGLSLSRAGFLAGVPPTRLAAEHPPTHPAAPRRAPPWHARATGKLQSLAPAQFGHGKAGIGRLRRSPAAERSSGKQRRRPARQNPPSRPIRNRRPRLEPQLFRSEPLDRDPSAQIQRYRFAMVVLHKNPSVFLESTRSPLLFKNIYGLAQFLAVNPLSFLEFEPAIQGCCFCELDPRTKF